MDTVIELLVQHGYLILLLWVFLDQLALPVPALPMVLAAGALAGQGHLSLAVCFLIVVIACTPPNLLWYWLGIHQGNKVLTLLCIVELETDKCIDKTTSAFHRYGTVSLLFAKFVPGLQTIAPPMAGLLGVPIGRFMLLDALGSAIYALVLLVPAYFAHESLAEIGAAVADLGSIGLAALLAAVLLWLGWKIARRQVFLKELRATRIEPERLHAALERDEPLQVADLRQRMEFNADPHTIPGAVRVPLDIFDETVERLSKERPLVLFCT